MATQTTLDLITELAARYDEMFVSTPTSTGTTTTLVDTLLNQELPNNVAAFNAWVYGRNNVVLANRGIERRAYAWTANSSTLTFRGAWPTAPTALGVYEIHKKFRRGRLLEALNSALRRLGLFCYRQVQDMTITTEQGIWRYLLNPEQAWTQIYRIEIQEDTNEDQETFPYTLADDWGWDIYTTDENGQESFWVQFRNLPPPGRILRIIGEGYFPDLVYDYDTLNLDGRWAGSALEWIFDWAEYRLDSWLLNQDGAGDEAQKLMAKRKWKLEESEAHIKSDIQRTRGGRRVVTPMSLTGSPTDLRYFGALSSTGMG